MIVSRQFNYNIPVRSYSIFKSKKACKIKACGVLQTPFRSNESYMELNPCKELSPYIRCYWGTKRPIVQVENDNKVDILIPDTCVDIIYHIDYTDKLVEGGFCGINDHSFESFL